MKPQPKAVTVAMVRDPAGTSWQAEIQIDYKGKDYTDQMRLFGDSPKQLLHRASNMIEERIQAK